MFQLQEQILAVASLLICLTQTRNNQLKLVIQRTLVLLGDASHSVSLERQKFAWAKINLELKSLALEDYKDRKDKLFKPGFLEASKKLDTDKVLAKVLALRK